MDKTFTFELTVEEMQVTAAALKDYWASKVQAVAKGPMVVNSFSLSQKQKEHAEIILGEEERKWTRQARVADTLRQRLEPLVEEHEETTRVAANVRS